MMRIYSSARSITSSGEPMISSSGRAATKPTTASTAPPTRDRSTAVCTVSETRSASFAPVKRATSTFTPMERPTNRLMIMLLSEPTEPTAASASLPANRPTTMVSAALKSSCKMPESIIGSEKNSTLVRREPSVISMVRCAWVLNITFSCTQTQKEKI